MRHTTSPVAAAVACVLGAVVLCSYFGHAFGLSRISSCSYLGTGFYLDISDLTCKTCPANTSPSADGLSCVCLSGFYQTTSKTCVACPVNTVTRFDGFGCIPCQNGTAPNSAKECPRCSGNRVLVERSSAGSLLAQRICQSCPENSLASASDTHTCLTCPDPLMTRTSQTTCDCPTGYVSIPENRAIGTMCIEQNILQTVRSKYPTSTSSQVVFSDVRSADNNRETLSVESETFKSLFISSYILCQSAKDVKSCQVLGNLCVLQLFKQSSSACLAYAEIASSSASTNTAYPQWPERLPWLYYNTDAKVVLNDESIFRQKYTFKEVGYASSPSQKTSQVQFVFAKYNISGDFQGWEDLVTPIQFCPMSEKQINDFLVFGYQFSVECLVDLTPYVQSTNNMYFYDLYLLDDDLESLRPVPVRVVNYRNPSGVKVNSGGVKSETFLTRRFFLVDNISGISSSGLQVVRFLQSTKIVFQLQSDSPGRIYIPLMTVEYGERLVTDISSSYSRDVEQVTLARPKTWFETKYEMSMGKFWDWAEIVYGLLSAIYGLVWIYTCSIFMRKRRNFNVDGEFLVFSFVCLCQYAAQMFFFILGISTLYYFCYFKGQEEVNLLLPGPGGDRRFEIMLIVAFLCQTISLVATIRTQVTNNFFIIDWEKPRSKLFGKMSEQGSIAPVPVWRTLFVANELNELMNEPMYKSETTLFGVLFFLQILGLNYLAAARPGGDDLSEGPTHPILRYAVAVIFWSIVLIIQYLTTAVSKKILFGDPYENFLDFISVCNISIIILDQKYHGFYLHGKSVHSFADTNMMEISDMFKREAENLCSKRGLVANTDLQSFEIFITPKLREKYDAAFHFLANDTKNQNAGPRGKDKDRRGTIEEKTMQAHNAMNRFLAKFIENSLNEGADLEYSVTDKTFFETYFPFAPDTEKLNKNIFYTDPLNNWKRNFWGGVEYEVFLFDFFLYAMVDHFEDDPLLSVFIVFLVHKYISYKRGDLSQSNLSNKTFVDNRFLI